MVKRRDDHIGLGPNGRMQCGHCGDSYTPTYPIDIGMLVAMTKQFTKSHRSCKPPKEHLCSVCLKTGHSFADCVRLNVHTPEQWPQCGDTGVSSRTIWRHMTGAPPDREWGSDAPYDPSDFGRCYRLLAKFKEWRPRIGEMAQYPAWNPMALHWAELEKLPPFGGGMCFLCATDGPPGRYSPAIWALSEDVDARKAEAEDEDRDERRNDIEDIFAEAAEHGLDRRVHGQWRHRGHDIGNLSVVRTLDHFGRRRLALRPVKCTWCRRPTHLNFRGPIGEFCSKRCRSAAYAKRKLAERRATGRCQDGCGRHRIEGSARCKPCLIKQRDAHKSRRARLRAHRVRPEKAPPKIKPVRTPRTKLDPQAQRERRRTNERRRRAAAREALGPSYRRTEWEKKHAKLWAAREAWLAKGPTCTWCHGPITYIPKTGALPEKCSKKCRAAAHAKALLDERRALGLCQDCGASTRTDGSRCAPCAKKQRAHHRRRAACKREPGAPRRRAA